LVYGANTLESLSHHLFLFNSAVELSGMDKVELLFENPWLVGIINYEASVWWNAINELADIQEGVWMKSFGSH